MAVPIFQKPPLLARVMTAILGVLIFLFGLFFLYFGAELAWLGGSCYYVLCGIALTISGIALYKRLRIGAYIYLLAWAATFIWTIYEVQFNWWGWLPRLFGPTLIAIPIILLLPFIYPVKIIKDERKF